MPKGGHCTSSAASPNPLAIDTRHHNAHHPAPGIGCLYIAADPRLPDSVREVEVRTCGQERIIAPLGRSWDSFFLEGPRSSDDFLTERASQEQADREAF